MKRREVIKRLAYAVPAGMAFPSILTSCNENRITPTPVYDGSVIILGAGAAGLSAAQQLKERNIDVTILEASDRYGGRVRLQKEFFDFPMEEGADWIQGNNNVWHTMVDDAGAKIIEYPDNPSFEVDSLVQTADDLSADADFLSVMNFVSDVPNYNGPDLTVRNAAISAGITPRVQHIADAMTANPRGSSFETISMKGISVGEQLWNDGEGKYLVENQALVNILGGRYHRVVGSSVLKLNTQITSINYSDLNKIVLTDSSGGTHECTVLISTVPVNILKDGDISFSPSLPISKTSALDRIGMDKGYKVMLGFYVNFWGQEVSSIYTDGTVPEYYCPGKGRSSMNRMLSALINGKHAEALIGKSHEDIIQLLLGELDELYDGEASQQYDETTTYVTDWGNNPFIKGVKSYPLVSGTGAAEELAKPINKRLFFAGEATATKGNYGTVQGALESADRVVKEVLEAIL